MVAKASLDVGDERRILAAAAAFFHCRDLNRPLECLPLTLDLFLASLLVKPDFWGWPENRLKGCHQTSSSELKAEGAVINSISFGNRVVATRPFSERRNFTYNSTVWLT